MLLFLSIGLITLLVGRCILGLLLWFSLEKGMFWLSTSLSQVLLLYLCLFFLSSLFGYAYKAQHFQGQWSCKVICAQQLADMCRYKCVEVESAAVSTKDYVNAVQGTLLKVE